MMVCEDKNCYFCFDYDDEEKIWKCACCGDDHRYAWGICDDCDIEYCYHCSQNYIVDYGDIGTFCGPCMKKIIFKKKGYIWDPHDYVNQNKKLYDEMDDIDWKIYRKNFIIIRIQRAWRRCVSDPEYNICRKRLLREFDDLIV